MIGALISELPSAGEETASIPESLAELTKLFEELLLQRSSEAKPLVIVVDALDELPPEADEEPPYLGMEGLPPGVFFVVTSRPGGGL